MSVFCSVSPVGKGLGRCHLYCGIAIFAVLFVALSSFVDSTLIDTLLGRMSQEQTPRARAKVWYAGDEPLSAVRDYLKSTDRFEVDPVLNGKLILASSPGGYLRCVG